MLVVIGNVVVGVLAVNVTPGEGWAGTEDEVVHG